MKVHVYLDEASDYRWHLKADNGRDHPRFSRGLPTQRYAITMAKKQNPGAELVANEKSEG